MSVPQGGIGCEWPTTDGKRASGQKRRSGRALAQHYGFTGEELDTIINYDIKCRMGREEETGEG